MSSMHVVNASSCCEFDSGTGEFIREQLGVVNGKCETLSSALVKIVPEKFSQMHFHNDREEAYIMISGEAKLVVDKTERTLRPGDVAHIPRKAIHQIFNTAQEDLIFNCISAPAWILDDTRTDFDTRTNVKDVIPYVRKEAETTPSTQGDARTFKVVGTEDTFGNAQIILISRVEIAAGKALETKPAKKDGCFLIKEGKGLFAIDTEEKPVSAGDVAKIPAELTTRISTVGEETLILYQVNVTV